IKETSQYMMSFVIITKENNAIVIDGGRSEDMPSLKECVDGRHISAWIFTHPHIDHIGGFVSEMENNCGRDFDIEKIYYNFLPYELIENKNVPNYKYHCEELNEMLPSFNRVLPLFKDKTKIVNQGDTIYIDECRIDFIFSWHEGLYSNIVNDSSLVFKITTPNKSVLFLGDLGPEGGDILFRESRHLLKSDIVQMAHHGHMNVGFDVYAEIMPDVCLWCCPESLYNEEELPWYLSDTKTQTKNGRLRLYGTALTRKWMNILGVKKHYVSKDGTHKIEL
ncbi:MAG: MBL fold metallo-hydrolase, partial [Clostridia bacterium]|nr:MBL fold metallo-hydrolase [Clostridia bacterium]